MNIVVLGYIIRGPLGGLVWHHLQYVLTLNSMGHNVLFVEDSDDFSGCYNPKTFEINNDPKFGLGFINDLFKNVGLTGKWAYFDAHTNTWYGKTKNEVYSFGQQADMVMNLSGINPARDWWLNIPNRLFIDTDPGFVQVRHLTNSADRKLAEYHNYFFTFGENIGKPFCNIPDDGFKWLPTRQPLYLDAWKISLPQPEGNWTTIMQWDSYREQEYNGLKLGMKSISFEPFKGLPELMTEENFELALGSASAPRQELKVKGWIITNPYEATKDAFVFQKFIAASKGEWTVAKHGYVETNSGWFSERSLNYMASGKPVIVQETGFSELIETGKGVFSFTSLEDVKENISRVNSDYSFHCKHARVIAEEYFNGEKVMQSLLDRI